MNINFSDFIEKMAHLVTHRKLRCIGIEIPVTKLESSIRLLSWVIKINFLFYRSLRRSIGDKSAERLVIVSIAPYIEEAAKAVSIKGHFGKQFYAIFNIYEAFSYIKKNARDGVSLIQNLKTRLATSLMHLATTIVQKIFSLRIVQSAFDPKNIRDAKEKAMYISFVISTFIHSAWNYAATTC